MRPGGAVLDDEDTTVTHFFRLCHGDDGVRVDDRRVWLQSFDVALHRADALDTGGSRLRDDAHVREANVRLTWVIAQLVAGSVRLDEHDVQRRLEERQVVVPSIPEQDVRIFFRLAEDLLVVDAGE